VTFQNERCRVQDMVCVGKGFRQPLARFVIAARDYIRQIGSLGYNRIVMVVAACMYSLPCLLAGRDASYRFNHACHLLPFFFR